MPCILLFVQYGLNIQANYAKSYVRDPPKPGVPEFRRIAECWKDLESNQSRLDAYKYVSEHWRILPR